MKNIIEFDRSDYLHLAEILKTEAGQSGLYNGKIELSDMNITAELSTTALVEWVNGEIGQRDQWTKSESGCTQRERHSMKCDNNHPEYERKVPGCVRGSEEGPTGCTNKEGACAGIMHDEIKVEHKSPESLFRCTPVWWEMKTSVDGRPVPNDFSWSVWKGFF